MSTIVFGGPPDGAAHAHTRASPREPTTPDVVIVMLAHDAIAQPDVWAAWLALGDGGVALAVHTSAEKRTRVGTRLNIPFGKTEWCGASIVLETARAYAAALDAFPSARFFVLVSGFCVPVHPPQHVAAFLRAHNMNIVAPTAFGVSAWPGLEYERPPDIPHWHTAPQWTVLTRESARRVAEHFSERTRVETYAWAWTLDKMRGDERACPDNMFIPTFLSGVPYLHACTTVECRTLFAQSPHEWTDLDACVEGIDRCTWRLEHADDVFAGAVSLRSILAHAALHPTNLFFRKVMPSVAFDAAFWHALWHALWRGEARPEDAPCAAPSQDAAHADLARGGDRQFPYACPTFHFDDCQALARFRALSPPGTLADANFDARNVLESARKTTAGPEAPQTP